MSHRKHTQSSQLFRSIEHHRRKSAWHFRIQTNLDTSLDFILTLHQEVQQFLSVDDSLSKVCHKTNQSSIPFVYNLQKKEKKPM